MFGCLCRQLVLIMVFYMAICASRSNPVTIEYLLSGDNYSYTVTNNMQVPLQDFAIFFPKVSAPDAKYYTLNGSTSPGGWSSVLFQPSAIDLGGFVEWYGGSIAPNGGSLSGFMVNFSYDFANPLATTPSSQYFEVYDANFALLDSGQTILLPIPGVPEPSPTMAYLLLAVLCLAAMRKKFRAMRTWL